MSYESTLAQFGGIPGFIFVKIGGGGITKKTLLGSHSIIIRDAEYPYGTPVISGHELFGHGRPLYLNRTGVLQHEDAIKVENLIYRVMGINCINDGQNHYDNSLVNNPTELPSFR